MIRSRAMTELPTAFGKYYLTELLATGGMAEIYLGKLVGPGGFEKPLVIKQIHPKLSGQRHFVDLFVAEAKTLVTLAHGNIVPVYELGVIDDTYFIAMDYIDGPTLYRFTEAVARRGEPMRPAIAAWIAARILEGLDYAHRKGEGVIHRDLSPRNVMLSRDGEVKLVDFGIAVTLGEADGASDVQSAPTGSFPYMSPEQVRREPLTGQTDLFSVGVLMWEMLVGRRLFARPDPDATLAAVTGGDIARPSAYVEIPARLDELVMRALARDTGERWASAAEMLHELQRYLYALDETPGPRDLAALVARYCPPETRRQPTHAEPAEADSSPVAAPVVAGPSTAVIPRDATRRRTRARTETFATHVALEHMLERGETAPPPAPAAPGADVDATRVAAPASSAVPAALAAPPSSRLIQLLAIGTLVAGGVAVAMFVRDHDRPAAALPPDAAVVLADAAPAADAPPPPPDAAPDAAPPRDAPPSRTRPDAAVATPVVTGSGRLRIGAVPWGEIAIDGRPHGRTPRELTLPVGRHVVEIVFAGEDPPRTKRIVVDLAAGETEDVLADFTR